MKCHSQHNHCHNELTSIVVFLYQAHTRPTLSTVQEGEGLKGLLFTSEPLATGRFQKGRSHYVWSVVPLQSPSGPNEQFQTHSNTGGPGVTSVGGGIGREAEGECGQNARYIYKYERVRNNNYVFSMACVFITIYNSQGVGRRQCQWMVNKQYNDSMRGMLFSLRTVPHQCTLPHR